MNAIEFSIIVSLVAELSVADLQALQRRVAEEIKKRQAAESAPTVRKAGG